MVSLPEDVPGKDRSKIPLQQWEIYIVGTRMFQNSLMATILSRELSIPCHCIKTPGSCRPQKDSGCLILLDSLENNSFSDLVDSCRRFFDPPDPACLLAIFNAGPEVKAISRRNMPAGVRGVFFANEPFDMFLKGITCILKGDHWLPRELLNTWIRKTRRPGDSEYKDSPALTLREKEILRMVATGASNDMISQELYISYHTVKTHLSHIYRKINVSSRLQASLWAAKNL